MRKDQRHRHAVAMQVINELSYSDHKPVVLKIRTKLKKWRAASKPQPNIKWEALRIPSKQQEFRRRTAELIENDEVVNPEAGKRSQRF